MKKVEPRLISDLTVGRTECRIVFESLVIIIAIGLHALGFVSPWTLPLVWIIVASRQHALLVLMHEGVHWRISRNRFWNDLVSEFTAWQFFVSMHGYRRHHLLHHKLENLNTPLDPDWRRKQKPGRAVSKPDWAVPKPDWAFPMSRSKLVRILVQDLTLLNTADFYHEAKDAKNNLAQNQAEKNWQAARLTYFAVLTATLILTGYWKLWLLYWIVPLFTVTKVILRIRSIGDHFAIPGGSGIDAAVSRTRTVLGSWFDRLILAPCSISVHGPHHMNAAIPYYHLREAHRFYLAHSKIYQQHARAYETYGEALNECLQPPSPRISKVSADADLLEYQRETAKYLEVEFPLSYLKDADVYIFRAPGGPLIGGFAFASKGELRTLMSLPSRAGFENEKFVELTGLWLAPEVSRASSVLKFWLAISWAAMPFFRNRLVFTYTASKRGLSRLYSILHAEELYRGTTPLLEGMRDEEVESLNATACFRLAFLPILHPRFYRDRIRARVVKTPFAK